MAPAPASASAMEKPMPLLDPVMKAMRPDRSKVDRLMSSSLGKCGLTGPWSGGLYLARAEPVNAAARCPARARR